MGSWFGLPGGYCGRPSRGCARRNLCPIPLKKSQRFSSSFLNQQPLVFAVASFAGLREGEIEGLEWPDYRDGALSVAHNVWNGRVGKPKTTKSEAPVPVIRQLADRLEKHRLRCRNPSINGLCPVEEHESTVNRTESQNQLTPELTPDFRFPIALI